MKYNNFSYYLYLTRGTVNFPHNSKLTLNDY